MLHSVSINELLRSERKFVGKAQLFCCFLLANSSSDVPKFHHWSLSVLNFHLLTIRDVKRLEFWSKTAPWYNASVTSTISDWKSEILTYLERNWNWTPHPLSNWCVESTSTTDCWDPIVALAMLALWSFVIPSVASSSCTAGSIVQPRKRRNQNKNETPKAGSQFIRLGKEPTIAFTWACLIRWLEQLFSNNIPVVILVAGIVWITRSVVVLFTLASSYPLSVVDYCLFVYVRAHWSLSCVHYPAGKLLVFVCLWISSRDMTSLNMVQMSGDPFTPIFVCLNGLLWSRSWWV